MTFRREKVNKHLDEGTLQALLDGELAAPDRAAAEAHLAACAECAGELRALSALEERLGALLGQADHPAPVAQAQMRFRARRAAAGQQRFGGEARRALLRAAMLVLGLAGVAAASVPGSPVRAWIEETVLPPEKAVQAPVAQPEAQPPAPAAAPVAEAPAGVSIRPRGGAVRVVLTGAAPGLSVRARLVEGEHAEVFATGAARGARFRTSPGRIEIAGAGAGEVTVGLPRGAREATVEVNGRVYVAKEGGALRVMTPVADPASPEAVFRVGG
jgi:hypothetical protein